MNTGSNQESKLDAMLTRLINMERSVDKRIKSKGLMTLGGASIFLVLLVLFLVFQAKIFS